MKLNIPDKEYNTAYQAYFLAIAALYRSIFKGLDENKVKLNISDFTNNQDYINDIHQAIITIFDKDIGHIDKNSTSHRLHNINALKNGGSTVMISSQLSEEQLQKAIDFLETDFLPTVNEAINKKQ